MKNLFPRRTGLWAILLVVSLVGISCVSGGISKKTDHSAVLPLNEGVERGMLDNGLSWQILRNAEPANRIFFRFAVRAGSVLEADDQKGIAHLVEHMAFNGTEHFEKNELVNYFETIGMAFGPEVNAYTSFEETVYMLEVPADDPEILQNTFLILRDWAAGLTFDQIELDKERGVVIEEWRQGRGADGRNQDVMFPFIFAGSRYAERLPIGDPEIVRTVSRDRVMDFYRDWYRPELMNLTVVGDFDSAIIRSGIESSLGLIPASAIPVELPSYSLGKPKKSSVRIFRDPEIPYITVQMLEDFPYIPLRTEAALRDRLVRNIGFRVFNERLAELQLSGATDLLATDSSSQRLVGPARYSIIAFVPRPGAFVAGFEELLTELERLEIWGITEGELERAQNTILNNAQQAWLGRAKAHSGGFVNDLFHEFLIGDTAVSIEDEFALFEQIIPGITAKEVHDSIRSWFTGRGRYLYVSAPQADTDIPSEKELHSMWQKYRAAGNLESPVDPDLENSLYEISPLISSGAIVAENPIAGTDIKEWVLSNGAKVLVYPTNFKDNEILFGALSFGGMSLVSDEDFPSALIATSWSQMSGLGAFSAADLQKKLSGKSVSLIPFIEEGWEGFYGASAVSDLETLMQLVALNFTSPRFSPESLIALMDQLQTVASSRKNNPVEVFSDLKAFLRYGDTIRRSNLSEELVSLMDGERAQQVWNDRFTDAGDFTFVFVGSFDEAALREQVITYLATLPSSGSKEHASSSGINFPQGVIEGSVSRGLEPKSQVFIAFGGEVTPAGRDWDYFDSLISLLQMRFREVIREDMSGTYGVAVNGVLNGLPENNYEISIEFGCEPGQEDKLTNAVLQEIENVRKELASESLMQKLREGWRRENETGLRNNGWWLSQIIARQMQELPLSIIAEPQSFVPLLTTEAMRKQARLYLDPSRRVRAVLRPEAMLQ